VASRRGREKGVGGRGEKGIEEVEVGEEEGRREDENGRGREGQRRKGESKKVKTAFWNVAGLGNKDRDFWRETKDWDVVVMSETWVEKKGWERIRERMTRGFRWKVQMAGRKNKKGRAIGGMVIGVKNGIEVIEEEGNRGDNKKDN